MNSGWKNVVMTTRDSMVGRYSLSGSFHEKVRKSIYRSMLNNLNLDNQDPDISAFNRTLELIVKSSHYNENSELHIVSNETKGEEYASSLMFQSTEGLVFSVVPTIHRVCLPIKKSWFNKELSETQQNLSLNVEYNPRFLGDVKKFQNWTLPLALKFLFGYFNDLQQMFVQFGKHYVDGHPGNILVKEDKGRIQFFWADPGKSESGSRTCTVPTKMNLQFLGALEEIFTFMETSFRNLPTAHDVVESIIRYHNHLVRFSQKSRVR